MNCFYHAEREAVAQCQNCGKGLCRECASLLNQPYCIDCVREYAGEQKKQMIKCIVLGLVIGITFSIWMESAAYLMFGWIPFGYTFLSKLTPKFFIVMPIVGWVIYFAVKILIAYFIGWLVLPFKMYKWIKEIRNAAAIERMFRI